MPSIITGGAFFQQCFAVHPLCLAVKMVKLPDKLGISCSNCKMRYRLSIGTLSLITPEGTFIDSERPPPLDHCAIHHMDDLRIQEVHIEKNKIQIRCRPCKVSYHLTISLFETYQP
ncbi:MAG: hypothetical protein VST68_00485 [Nitrospirota bacterium]|nr:hypothetical protein [Nitrospirota bacterium]